MKAALGTSLVLGAVLAVAFAGENGGAPNSSHKLGQLAASMKPGEWKELVTEGFDKSLLQDTGEGGKPAGHWIFQYTNKIHWYSKTQELYFIGAGHRCKGKFIAYSAGKNAWRSMPLPEPYKSRDGRSGLSHSYENTTIDEEKGLLVRQCHDMPKLLRYEIATGKWLEPIDAPGKQGHESATEYFPEMKTYVQFQRNGARRLMRWDRAAQKWSAIDHGVAADAPRELHPMIEYNPVHKLMLFGGSNGHSELFALSADGKVKAIAKAPVETVNSTFSGTLTVDPVSGEFLLYAREKGKTGDLKLYACDVEQDKWRVVSDAVPMAPKKGSALSTPVVDHGVVLFCTYNPPKVWLYKHAAAAGDR